MKWVPCKKKLPRKGTACVVTMEVIEKTFLTKTMGQDGDGRKEVSMYEAYYDENGQWEVDDGQFTSLYWESEIEIYPPELAVIDQEFGFDEKNEYFVIYHYPREKRFYTTEARIIAWYEIPKEPYTEE